MAFMNQERKAQLAAELKAVAPADWKWSLAVRHHSTIVFTLRSAPVDVVAAFNAHNKDKEFFQMHAGNVELNVYHLQNQFSGELRDTFVAIRTALNTGNHNRSDISTDYFDVGWYVDIRVGAWDKPFELTAPRAIAPAVDLTEAGEQYVIPGCEQRAAAAPGTQLGLWAGK